MAANLIVEHLSASVDLEAAAVGGTRVKVHGCELRVTRSSLNAALKAALRVHEGVRAVIGSIDSGTIVLKGKYKVLGFGAELLVVPGRSGRVHLDLATFSALRLPVGEISSLRDRVAEQLRAAIAVREGVVPGSGSRLVTIDVRALARQRGIELPPLSALLVDRDAVVLRFAAD